MEVKIQFETRNPLPDQEEIKKIKDLPYVVSSPNSFKYECSPAWAQGKDIPVEQSMIFWSGFVLLENRPGETLGIFVENWKDIL